MDRIARDISLSVQVFLCGCDGLSKGSVHAHGPDTVLYDFRYLRICCQCEYMGGHVGQGHMDPLLVQKFRHLDSHHGSAYHHCVFIIPGLKCIVETDRVLHRPHAECPFKACE